MILVIPLFFFILCLYEASHGKSPILKERKTDYLSDGLERLDYISEIPPDLDTLQSRYRVKYVYTHTD